MGAKEMDTCPEALPVGVLCALNCCVVTTMGLPLPEGRS